MIYKNSLFLIFFILLSIPFDSHAQKIKWRDRPEAAFLPPFCGTNTNPKYAGIKWDFGAYLNHYCEAKTTESKCFTKFGSAKKKCTDYLTKEYKYGMSYHKDSKNILFPFLYTEIGTVRAEAGDNAEAIKYFNLAITKNPRYLKAYVKLAKLYIKTKNYNDASALVDKGLSIKKHKTLLKLKTQLEKLSK